MNNVTLQLLPSPTEPLYLIAHRPILLYIYEYSDLEDLGFDSVAECGVVPVLSETLHWKRTGIWQGNPKNAVPIETLPWLNMEEYALHAHRTQQALIVYQVSSCCVRPAANPRIGVHDHCGNVP